MIKGALLFLSMFLLMSISFAQYGIGFAYQSAYWVLTIIACLSTYFIVFNTFSVTKTRENIAKPAGLFSATSVGFAFYVYRHVIESVIGPYVLVVIVAAGLLFLFSKIGNIKELKGKNNQIIFALAILLLAAFVLSYLGYNVGDYVMLAIVAVVLLLLLAYFFKKKLGPGPRPGPGPSKNYKLIVFVKDELGTFLPGETVTVSDKTSKTNKYGQVSFKLEEGTYLVGVTPKEAYLKYKEENVKLDTNKTITITLSKDLPPPVDKVNVIVEVLAGKIPVVDASVNLGGTIKRTDKKGETEFKDVALGEYKIVVSASGCDTKVYDNYEVQKSGRLKIELKCDKGKKKEKKVCKNILNQKGQFTGKIKAHKLAFVEDLKALEKGGSISKSDKHIREVFDLIEKKKDKIYYPVEVIPEQFMNGLDKHIREVFEDKSTFSEIKDHKNLTKGRSFLDIYEEYKSANEEKKKKIPIGYLAGYTYFYYEQHGNVGLAMLSAIKIKKIVDEIIVDNKLNYQNENEDYYKKMIVPIPVSGNEYTFEVENIPDNILCRKEIDDFRKHLVKKIRGTRNSVTSEAKKIFKSKK